MGSTAFAFLDQLETTTLLPQELDAINLARACSTDAKSVKAALTKAHKRQIPKLMTTLLTNSPHKSIVWELLENDRESLEELLHPQQTQFHAHSHTLESALRGSSSEMDLSRVEKLLSVYDDQRTVMALTRVKEKITHNISLKEKFGDAVDDWYKSKDL